MLLRASPLFETEANGGQRNSSNNKLGNVSLKRSDLLLLFYSQQKGTTQGNEEANRIESASDWKESNDS